MDMKSKKRKKLTIEQTRNMIEWIKALESGRYVATSSYLYRGDTIDCKPQMCCLGVACDVLIRGKWVDNPHVMIDAKSFFSRKTKGEKEVAPKELISLLGLDASYGFLHKSGEELTSINDHYFNKGYQAVLPVIRKRLKDLGHGVLRKQIESLLKRKKIAR
jgi:hypothetical protein